MKIVNLTPHPLEFMVTLVLWGAFIRLVVGFCRVLDRATGKDCGVLVFGLLALILADAALMSMMAGSR